MRIRHRLAIVTVAAMTMLATAAGLSPAAQAWGGCYYLHSFCDCIIFGNLWDC